MGPDPIIPRGLRKGDTIALISPSLRINELFPLAFARAITTLESLGFHVKTIFTPHPPSPMATSIAIRLAELRQAFADPDVTAIICTIGGATCTQLIPALVRDTALLDTIRTNPKIFVGYSDITTLHWTIAKHTGLRTFYGPGTLPELCDTPETVAFNVTNLLRAVSRDPELLGPGADTSGVIGAVARSKVYAPLQPGYILRWAEDATEPPQGLAPSPKWRWVRGGKAEGRLFGGCVSLVQRLMGISAVRPGAESEDGSASSLAGRIVFLESAAAESDINRGYIPDKWRQSLVDLVAGGMLEEAAGLVIGRCYGYDSEGRRRQFEDIVRDVLCPEEVEGGEQELAEGLRARNKFPILLNVDIGHTTPMVTLPYGALARLDSEADEFSILEASVI